MRFAGVGLLQWLLIFSFILLQIWKGFSAYRGVSELS